VREPVLRNAAAAGSHPDVCAPPPLSGFPELPGPDGLVVGLAGAAGPVGVAGVVAGLGFDELPDFPGPLPLLFWLFGFGWFVEPLSWLPELLFPELFPELLLPELWLPWLPELFWFPWLPFVGWSVGLPGDGVGLSVCFGGPMRSTQ
jgi:hypothetical protein